MTCNIEKLYKRLAMVCYAHYDNRWGVRIEIVVQHRRWRGFKKNEFKPHMKKSWRIPPDQNTGFVATMEDVLAIYARSFDEKKPVICIDENPVQLFATARKRLDSIDGQIDYEDNKYIRNGIARISMFI